MKRSIKTAPVSKSKLKPKPKRKAATTQGKDCLIPVFVKPGFSTIVIATGMRKVFMSVPDSLESKIKDFCDIAVRAYLFECRHLLCPRCHKTRKGKE